MGNYLTIFHKKKELRAYLLGLNVAGKTSLLYRMKYGETVKPLPTVGFNIDKVEHKNIGLIIWDVGGNDRIRPSYFKHFTNINVFIYVIDSSGKDRIEDDKNEISKYLNEDEFRDCIVLVIANKQDLKDALPVDEIKKLINFESIKQEPKHIIGASALTGEGIHEAFDWIASNSNS